MSKCVKCGNEILTGDIHWEMGLCNNCYNELYKDHKTHISLDKMWLKLAQDFRDENEKLQDNVADLKAKLAETEKRFQEHKQTDSKTIQGQSDLIEKLKQQLAEYVKIVDDLHKQLSDKCDFCDKTHSQDKISFCIEQLEWLKEKINNAKIHKIDMINTHELYEILDNKIKELKEVN